METNPIPLGSPSAYKIHKIPENNKFRPMCSVPLLKTSGTVGTGFPRFLIPGLLFGNRIRLIIRDNCLRC